MQSTLTIIKPHAVNEKNSGKILQIIEESGFRIAGLKLLKLTVGKAEEFYAEHKGREFYEPLVKMMSSGPIVVALLQKENAIADFRKLVGTTDPGEAAPGTIRKLFGKTTRENSVHASDSIESAMKESAFFFNENEIY